MGSLEGIGKGAKPAFEGDPSSVCSAANDIGRGGRVCQEAPIMDLLWKADQFLHNGMLLLMALCVLFQAN